MMVLSSSVGLLTPRAGGHPLKLTFYVRASELLNLELKRMDTLNDALKIAATSKKIIGNSVTINLEAAAPSNKLQISPLFIKNSKSSDGQYCFQPITNTNSTMLPATFCLRLNKSFPIASKIVEEIKKITNLNVFEESSATVVKVENSPAEISKEPSSLLNLIINLESQGSYENSQKGLFVSLADQAHCYFISDNPVNGINIKSIQFTEPSQAIKIVKLLREQALFNALIASCVRQNSKYDHNLESCYMFEVNIVSLQYIQIFVEHPLKESMITVELDLSDVRKVNCKINGSDMQYDPKLENYINRVLMKTNSIPMVTRSLLKYWDNEANEMRMQKRLFNNGLYGISDPKSNGSIEKKDDLGKDEGSSSNGNDDSYGGSGQDSGNFDICGINKNEIFFKTNEHKGDVFNRKKRIRTEGGDVDIFDQNNQKYGRIMSYDLNDENDEMILPERNLLSDELMHNENSSASPISSGSSEGSTPAKKNEIHSKNGSTPSQKSSKASMDVFEFNDPSPPHQLPMQSPKRIPTPRQSPSGGVFNQEKRIHDIEIIPLKNQRNIPSPSMDSSSSTSAVLNQTTSITITPINNSNFFYKGNEKKPPIDEKLKSEKKKKRKREDGGDMGSPALMKKKSSDSLGSSPSKKSPSGAHQMMGKPQASFKPMKSPISESGLPDPSSSPKIKHSTISKQQKLDDFHDADDLSFLNTFDSQQQVRSQFI